MAKYIDADALMEYLQEIKQQAEEDNKTKFDAFENVIDVINSTIMMKTDEIMRIVENMPAADVEPVKHGKWLSAVMEDDCNEIVEYCSECHYVRPRNSWKSDFNYCPKCGAKMDGGSE